MLGPTFSMRFRKLVQNTISRHCYANSLQPTSDMRLVMPMLDAKQPYSVFLSFFYPVTATLQ